MAKKIHFCSIFCFAKVIYRFSQEQWMKSALKSVRNDVTTGSVIQTEYLILQIDKVKLFYAHDPCNNDARAKCDNFSGMAHLLEYIGPDIEFGIDNTF